MYTLTNDDHVVLPHSLLAQRYSTVNLPPKLTCRSLDIILRGYLSPINDLTVSRYCYMTIDHHTPTVNHIKTLDLKSFSKLIVTTHQDATTTLEGDTLDVRSGALVRLL
ncbi:hypothetical protein LSAT2_026634 [Lamellibrachia satsuma]|nr:hypothetical protein LSAT2_026634 [Lamellibrachia satsuma]